MACSLLSKSEMRSLIVTVALLTFLGILFAQDRNILRLGQELQSPDLGVRRQAAIGLGRVSQPQSVRLLQQALANEQSASIRLELVRALRNIAFLRYPGYREALQALGNAANEAFEPDLNVRLRATQALWEAGKKDLLNPVPFLDRNLDDSSQRLRLASVQMLRKLGTPATIPPLGRAANDKAQPETIRLRAIEALGAVSLAEGGVVGRAIAATNIAVANRLGREPIMPAAALEKRHEQQIRFLGAVLQDPDNSSTLALRAVKSVGQVKDKSSVPILQQVATTHGDAAVRSQALRAISHVLARQYE